VLAESADKDAAKTLKGILKVEKKLNVKTTYNIVGSFLNEVKATIEKDGHCNAFHSYNHKTSRHSVTNYMCDDDSILALLSKIGYKVTYFVNLVRRLLSLNPFSYQPIATIYRNFMNTVRKRLSLSLIINQFAACRSVDWRIKGYRHYQPKITSEVSDNDLCYYNFEWIAIDEKALGTKPTFQNRIVKIPVFCDDYEMYKHNVSYETWEKSVIDRIKQSNYADYWLSQYSTFLDKIKSMGQLKTFNEVADQVFLANSI